MKLITTLPCEILLLIFQATDNLDGALRLSQTNRQFRSIWTRNTPAICQPLLRSSLPYFAKALQLADLLIKGSSTTHGDDTPHARTRILLRNAQTVSMTLRLFVADVVKPWGRMCPGFFDPPRQRAPFVSASERTWFTQAFYLTWVICHCSQEEGNARVAEQIFEEISPQTFQRMNDIAMWLSNTTNPDCRGAWERVAPGCAPETEACWSRIEIEARAWWEDAASIFWDAKGRSKRDERIKSARPGWSPAGMWAWFDDIKKIPGRLMIEGQQVALLRYLGKRSTKAKVQRRKQNLDSSIKNFNHYQQHVADWVDFMWMRLQ